MVFLHTFDVTNLVKNQKILEKFRVEEIIVRDFFYLKLSRIDDEEKFLILPIKESGCFTEFYRQDIIWNILESEFFPSSISILNKVIKLAQELVENFTYYTYLRSYQDFLEGKNEKNFINALNHATKDGMVLVVLLKYFSYRGLKFDQNNIPASYLLLKRNFRSRVQALNYKFSVLLSKLKLTYHSKPNLLIPQEDKQSPLYRAFISYVINGKFDKALFDSILLLFNLSNSNEELSQFLNSLKEEEDDLVVYLYNSSRTSIFTRGSLEKELFDGEEIFHSSFSWLNATKKRNINLERLTRGRRKQIDASQVCVKNLVSSVNKVKSLAQGQTNPEQWLSSKASEHYNKEVVPSYYWDLVES